MGSNPTLSAPGPSDHPLDLIDQGLADQDLRAGETDIAYVASDEGLTYVPPSDPAQERMAAIWQNVLGVDQVGKIDNFFELGGDSVLSIQIIARAHKAGLRLTPQQIFYHQTIAELAAVAVASQSASVVDQEAVTGHVPLTPIQRWYLEQQQPEPHHFNQSLMLEALQALDASTLRQAVEHLLQHHDALRMRFTHENSVWQQWNEAPGGVALPATSAGDLSGLGLHLGCRGSGRT